MDHVVCCLSSLDARLTDLEARGVRLDAPIPEWFESDDMFGSFSAENIEKFFASIYGDDIMPDYLYHFECQLRLMRWCIKKLKHDKMHFSCSVLDVIYAANDQDLIVFSVKTRPCAASLGLYRIFLYQMCLIARSSKKGRNIVIDNPLEKNIAILQRISPLFEECANGLDYKISTENVRQLCLENFGLQDRVRNPTPVGIELVRDRFPSHAQLNDQAAVDGRKMFRREDMDEMAGGGYGGGDAPADIPGESRLPIPP